MTVILFERIHIHLIYHTAEMTTIAFHQYCNISFVGGSYVASPIMQPMTEPHRPNDVHARPIDNGILSAKRANPPKFGVSDSAASFAMGRRQYTVADMNTPNPSQDAYSDPTDRLRRIKSSAIGSTINKDGQGITYKSYNVNDVKSALSKVRGHGCVAPAKKGAIENTHVSSCMPIRGFLPPNTSANSAGSKHSAFLSRHAKERLSCPVDETDTNCPIPDPANIEGATYSAFPMNHRTKPATRCSDVVVESVRKNSIFMPHYLRNQIACDDCPMFEPTMVAGTAIVVDANKFSTALPNRIKDRLTCDECPV